MEMVNRLAIIVTPRRRFVDWINTVCGDSKQLHYDDRSSQRGVYLVVGPDDEPDLQEIIEQNWLDLFAAELSKWSEDEGEWPVNRTAHIFRDWFEVDVVDWVNDLDDHEPFTVAEFGRTRCAGCSAPLDDSQIVVVARADDEVERWDRTRLERWEAEQDGRTDDEGSDEAGAVPRLVLRCCSEACADRLEAALRDASEGVDGE